MTAPTNIITITGINEDTTSDNSSADDFITKDKDGLTVTAMLSAALQPTETLQYSSDGGTTWINIPAENITNDTNVSYVDNALTTSTRIQFRVVNDAGENGSVTEQTVIIYETKNAEGTDGADPITGTSENDWIDAGSGDDIVNGAGGDDTVIGGLGADTITGGSGDDYIDGGDADDTLDGGAGNDTIYGGTGNDTITGDSGTPEASLSEAITLSGISAEDKWNSATVNLSDGRSLVVWSNTAAKEFQGRLVNAEGTAEGSVFTIFNTGTEGIDRAFELSALSDGRVLLGYTGSANDKGTLHVFNPDDPTNSTTNSTIYLTPDGSATLNTTTYSTYASFVTTNDTIIATGTSVHGSGNDIIRIYQKQQDGSYSHSNHQELTTDIEWRTITASYKHSNIIELENGQVLASIGSKTNYNIEGFLFDPETIANEFDFTKISLTESISDDETTATEYQHDSVALDNGGFAVVYGQSIDNFNNSSNNIDQIYLRLYDKNGNMIAPAHKISGEQTSEGYELGDNKYPAIAKTSDGNLAIAWVNDGYYMDTNNVNWADWSTAGIKTRFVNLDSSDNFVSLEDIVTVQLFGSYQYLDAQGNERTNGPETSAYENVNILDAGEGKVTVTWVEKNYAHVDATDDANGTYNDTFIKSVTVESAASASSNDVIYGEAGEDNISGGYGDDQLDGGADADTIDGDSGNDTLIGGAGSDTLTGGAGDDVFDVTSGVTSETSHKDTITDFGTGADTLDLSAYYNATSLAAWNAANPTKIYQSALDWLRADFNGSDDPEGDAAAKTLQLGRSDANEAGNTVFFSNNITSADLTEANTKVSADDTTAPTIASVTLADGSYGIGDPVPLTITATNNEPGLTLSSTTFNGQTLTDITDNGDGAYSATYTVQEGDPDLSDGGNASANLAFTDPANNTGPAFTSVALSGETIDATAPTIASVTLADGSYGIGDPVPLTITATNNEPGLTLSSTTFNGQTLTDITDNGDGTYSATYTVQEGDPDLSDGGNASANLAFTDPANNTGPAFTSVALSGETIDATAPTIASVTLADGSYGIGDPVPLTITATNNEPGLTLSSTTFNGQTLTDITDNGDGTYSATYTVQEGDPDLSDGGNASANLAFTDPANNTGPAFTSVELSGETIDTTAPEAPTLNQVTSDNLINASEAEAGFNITGTGEPGATITLAKPPTLEGGNTATVQNDDTWSIPVTQADVTAMGEGDTDLALTQTDPAGNISPIATQTITIDTATPAITPAILSAEMSFGALLTPDEMDQQADLTVQTANIEDGATISISTDGVSMTPVSATVEANKAVFSASAEELQSLRDGTYEFTLTVTKSPSIQHKQSFKKTGDIDGTENDDTINPTSGPNNTPYTDLDGDKVDGDDGNDDYIDAKGGNDIVDGGQGNDIIHGGTGNDILNGGVGDDTLDGGSGNDLLRGDTGNDSLKGGGGQDDLQGGDGDDSLDGGDGNDVLDGGTGADTLTGGAGQDEFIVDAGDTVADFDIEEDKIDLDDIYNFDTLARWNEENPNNSFSNPLQWLKSDQAGNDGLTGLDTDADPINLMNNGAFINASDLTQENTGVVCYGAATRIETIEGPKAIERLKPGDLVKTGGNGHRPIRWIGGRTIFYAELQAHPNLVPIRIKAGAMGKGLPNRDLIVSQHHRMVVSSDLSSAETGSKEIFISAKDLIGVPGIEIAIDLTEITYWHFICDQHQVVFAEGAASESLYTGPEALKMLGAEARAEIYQIFPQLHDAPPHYAPKPARPILSQEDSKSLIFQHYRLRTALCRQNSDAGMRPV